jgi:hypothetical protein
MLYDIIATLPESYLIVIASNTEVNFSFWGFGESFVVRIN